MSRLEIGLFVIAVAAGLIGLVLLAIVQQKERLIVSYDGANEALVEKLSEFDDLDTLVRAFRAIVHGYWEDQHRHMLMATQSWPEAARHAWSTIAALENLMVMHDQFGVIPVNPEWGVIIVLGDDDEPPESDSSRVR